jgi:prevent-host-death family protein
MRRTPMIQIRPISDLRNKFTELEKIVKEGEPVYLTKNGYGSMVVMSLETFADLTNDIEMKLDEADKQAALDDMRYSHDDVFEQLRRRVNGK